MDELQEIIFTLSYLIHIHIFDLYNYAMRVHKAPKKSLRVILQNDEIEITIKITSKLVNVSRLAVITSCVCILSCKITE